MPTEVSDKKDYKKRSINIIKITFLFLMVMVIGWLAFGFVTGWTGQKTSVETGVGLEKVYQSGGGAFSDGINNLKEWIQGTYGFKKPKVEEKEPSGIKITKLVPGSTYFESEKPITIRAEVRADALPKQNTRIEFFCNLDDQTAQAGVSGGAGNYVELQAGKSRVLQIVCKFENGIKVTEDKTKKVTFHARYNNFITRDTLKIYTLSEQAYASIGTEDPFKAFGVDDNLLSSKNIMQPQCVSGCGLTKLSLKTSPQPLTATEGANYFLDIELQNDRDWHGKIDAVNYIKVLKTPDKVSLAACSPEITTDSQEGDVTRLNEALESEKLSFSCEFAVNNPDELLGENVGQFLVEAQYVYDVEASTTVDIRKPRDLIQQNNNSKSATGSFLVSGILGEALQ